MKAPEKEKNAQAQGLAALRWKGVSDEDKAAHARAMARKRWGKKRRRRSGGK